MKYQLFTMASVAIVLLVSAPSCTITKYDADEKSDEFISFSMKGGVENNGLFISKERLADFLHYQDIAGEKRKVERTSEIEYKGETVAYLVEYQKGWEIVSACSRTNPIIAHDESGEAKSLEIDPINAWLQTVYDEIFTLAHLSEDEIHDSFDEQSIEDLNKFVEFWDLISPRTRKESISTKVHGPSDLSDYELFFVITDTVYFDEVGHLMETHWHQNHPYNQYCPLKSYSNTLRAPAGCVAIAGAQVLNYLHNYVNIPTHCPDSAYVSGNVNNYFMEQYGQSTEAWTYMTDANGKNAAILIANVGKKVNMCYTDSASYAYTSDLASLVYPTFGLDCTYTTFNPETLSNYICWGYPAITRASGHAFVIDGYKRKKVNITLVYRKIDPNNPLHSTLYRDYITTIPFINEFSMNWGWGEQYDNGYFSTTGDWFVNNYHFNDGRAMICDFFEGSYLPSFI